MSWVLIRWTRASRLHVPMVEKKKWALELATVLFFVYSAEMSELKRNLEMC